MVEPAASVDTKKGPLEPVKEPAPFPEVFPASQPGRLPLGLTWRAVAMRVRAGSRGLAGGSSGPGTFRSRAWRGARGLRTGGGGWRVDFRATGSGISQPPAVREAGCGPQLGLPPVIERAKAGLPCGPGPGLRALTAEDPVQALVGELKSTDTAAETKLRDSGAEEARSERVSSSGSVDIEGLTRLQGSWASGRCGQRRARRASRRAGHPNLGD